MVAILKTQNLSRVFGRPPSPFKVATGSSRGHGGLPSRETLLAERAA
jgi:hypothetical protein